MKKRVFYIIGSLLFVGGAVLLGPHWYQDQNVTLPAMTDKDLQEITKGLNAEANPSQAPKVTKPQIIKGPDQKIRLAMGSFGLASEAANGELGDLITAELARAQGLELVERLSMDKILQEMRLSLSGIVRSSDAVQVGKLLRADWFLLGSSAVVNKTNVVVVRIVDARTGIMLDGTVLPAVKGSRSLSRELAEFIRGSRDAAAEKQTRVYLALGSFRDLSPNNRLAEFPAQLRGFLTAAYQKGNVTLMERDYVTTLLNEVHLDMAGLTEASETSPRSPIQSAYWLIDGTYQSYESTSIQVELALRIQHVFGRHYDSSYRDTPGEVLFQKIKSAIDAKLNDPTIIAHATRVSEISAQLATGRALADFGMAGVTLPKGVFAMDATPGVQRNTEEAIRAFQTVLLLAPTNREAKVCLAGCYRDDKIRKIQEALDLYREVIESDPPDRWTETAQKALMLCFQTQSPETRLTWLENAAAHATRNTLAASFYQKQLKDAQEVEIIKEGGTKQAVNLAEIRLLTAVTNWGRKINFINEFADGAFRAYAGSFGTNRSDAAKGVVALLPKLREAAPALAPHILMAAVSLQVVTNAPIIKEFELSLDELAKHPNEISNRKHYCALLEPIHHWCEQMKLYALDAKVLAWWEQFGDPKEPRLFRNPRTIALAYDCMKLERWNEALSIFQSFSNSPVRMNLKGLWGEDFVTVLTSKQANLCRQKLGLPEEHDPREFAYLDSWVCFHRPTLFTADENGVWVGSRAGLIHLTHDLQTNRVYSLGIPASSFQCMAIGNSNLWIGTDEGLIRLDAKTGERKHWRDSDGLLMNSVKSLCPSGDLLWIGYGTFSMPTTRGGLSQMNLRTGEIKSYTRSMLPAEKGGERHGAENVPSKELTLLMTRKVNELLFVEQYALRKYEVSEDRWSSLPQAGKCNSWATLDDRLILGHYSDPNGESVKSGFLGVNIVNLANGKVRSIAADSALTHETISALALHGEKLWIGGFGFIALLDSKFEHVQKFAYVPAKVANRFEVAGGYLWAQFEKHLYRVPLAEVE